MDDKYARIFVTSNKDTMRIQLVLDLDPIPDMTLPTSLREAIARLSTEIFFIGMPSDPIKNQGDTYLQPYTEFSLSASRSRVYVSVRKMTRYHDRKNNKYIWTTYFPSNNEYEMGYEGSTSLKLDDLVALANDRYPIIAEVSLMTIPLAEVPIKKRRKPLKKYRKSDKLYAEWPDMDGDSQDPLDNPVLEVSFPDEYSEPPQPKAPPLPELDQQTQQSSPLYPIIIQVHPNLFVELLIAPEEMEALLETSLGFVSTKRQLIAALEMYDTLKDRWSNRLSE